MRHFHIFNLPEPSDDCLSNVFETIIVSFLHKLPFTESIKKQLPYVLVSSTIDLYRQITKELLPVPSKFHYVFSGLRDISKVILGMVRVRPSNVNTFEMFSKLWVHECSRVFLDRLITPDEKEFFKKSICDLVI
jgi:dynein heavy chain